MTRGRGSLGSRGSRGHGQDDGSSTSRQEAPSKPPPPIEETMDLAAATPGARHYDLGSHARPLISTSSTPTPHEGLTLSVAYVQGQRLMPETTSGHTTKIFKQNIHENGYNWKSVPEQKEEYFQEFGKHYRWDPTNDTHIHDIFMKQVGGRYRDMVYTFKRNRNHIKLNCVSEDAWMNWLVYWSQPEVIDLSKNTSNNRLCEVGDLTQVVLITLEGLARTLCIIILTDGRLGRILMRTILFCVHI